MLKAGVAGARAGNPAGHQLLIMMHYDQGGNNQLSQAFFQNLVSRGVPFDLIGLSYYPFFHGTMSQMRANVDALATQFHKKIVIAETQYAWTLANGDSTGDFVWQTSQVSAGYPASPGGQLSFVTDDRQESMLLERHFSLVGEQRFRGIVVTLWLRWAAKSSADFPRPGVENPHHYRIAHPGSATVSSGKH